MSYYVKFVIVTICWDDTNLNTNVKVGIIITGTLKWNTFTVFIPTIIAWNIRLKSYHRDAANVGPVGPRGQNFRGSGKWRLCVRPNDRQTFLLLGAVKNQISVSPGYLLDP
jgi:hypothetical protein